MHQSCTFSPDPSFISSFRFGPDPGVCSLCEGHNSTQLEIPVIPKHSNLPTGLSFDQLRTCGVFWRVKCVHKDERLQHQQNWGHKFGEKSRRWISQPAKACSQKWRQTSKKQQMKAFWQQFANIERCRACTNSAGVAPFRYFFTNIHIMGKHDKS